MVPLRCSVLRGPQWELWQYLLGYRLETVQWHLMCTCGIGTSQLGFLLEVSIKHPRSFYMGVPPRAFLDFQLILVSLVGNQKYPDFLFAKKGQNSGYGEEVVIQIEMSSRVNERIIRRGYYYHHHPKWEKQKSLLSV